ncbi:MAG TPA: FecR domain-containing protein [Polyangia bacterium]
MSDQDKERLAHHVRVDLSEPRVDRLWGGVSARLGGPRRARGWLWATALACTAAVVIFVVVRGRGGAGAGEGSMAAASAWEGAQLETAADALAVTLVDGSSLKVEPRSRVELRDHTPSALKLVLARGRIACDVTHREGRSFVVAAGGAEVRVVGTRFTVANEAAPGGAGAGRRVEVRVERGAVEVRGADGEVERVAAGHSWSQVTKTEALAAPETEAAPEAPAPADDEAAGPAAPAGRPHPAARPAHPAAADARALFEQARSQWRAGKMAEAAQTYQALLAAHPRDPRAGLAAFELGRLRMDRLNDLPGAVQALEQAVALAPGAELREDALARLVAAAAGARDHARCARARTRYLTEYPSGVHHRTVSAATCE